MASVLVVGGTGYIGAPFLTALRQKHSTLKITAYVRSTSSDHEFSALNIDVVHGTFDELEKLASLASKHDIAVNAASSTNPELTSALVKGLSTRVEPKGILIHVSGAGNFSDRGLSGNFHHESKRWNVSDQNPTCQAYITDGYEDANAQDISKIDEKMVNGACDKIILDAGAAGKITDFIVTPGGVYGEAETMIARGTRGVFLNVMLANCIQLGYSPYIGDGTAIFHLNEVNDVVSFMMLIFEKALKNEGPKGPHQRYYIVDGVDKTWKEIATVFATTLHQKGKLQDGVARRVAPDQAGNLARLLGANILVECDNAKALGHLPRGRDISETLMSLTEEL